MDTQNLRDNDPATLELSLQYSSPVTIFRVADDLLVCYEKVAYYVDRRGDWTRRELVMRWTRRSNAFALHEPYLLAFCNARVEVWNIQTAEIVQTVPGAYCLINTPDSGDKILSTSFSPRDVTEIVFHGRAS
ncbi:CNH domain-containing protein [Mycena polygramma]|nr:CNH domain-containing protein [Mycena polygramma]